MDFNKKYNILLSAIFGLGTTLFFIPFLKVLRLKFKNSKVSLLTWENNNVFAGTNLVDEVIEIKHDMRPISVQNVDLLFDLKTKDKGGIKIVSQPLIVAKKEYIIEPKDEWRHDDVYLNFLKDLPLNDAAKDFLFYLFKNFSIKEKLDVDALLFAENHLARFEAEEDLKVCLCLGNWSNKFGLININFYVDLVDGLVGRFPQIKILLIGKGSDEQKRAQQIIKNCKYRKNILSLVNLLTMQQLIKVFLKSKLIIGQDTGIVHLASCLAKNILLLTDHNHFNYPVSNKNNYIKVVVLDKMKTLAPSILDDEKLFL